MNDRLSELRRYFDLYWQDSTSDSRAIHDFSTFCRECTDTAVTWMGDLEGKRILEIGSGMGESSFLFSSLGAQVVSVDLSMESLKRMRSRTLPNLSGREPRLLMMDAERLGFRPGSFDIVFIQKTLMHMDGVRVVGQARTLLRGGGKVLLIEPLRYNPFVNLYRSLFSIGRFVSCRFLSWRQVDEMAAHFPSSRCEVWYFLSVLALPLMRIAGSSKIAALALSSLKGLDRCLIRRFRIVRQMGWFVVVELCD